MSVSPAAPDADDPRGHARFLALLAIVGAAALWIPQLDSSFRLDETATHWLISDGLEAGIDRAAEFQGESPLYTVALGAFRTVAGDGEVALRVPSLIAMAAAAWLLYRLGRRLAGPEAGAIAAVAFVVAEEMAFAAGDARPYAPAILALVAATLALVRWADGGRAADGVWYVLLAATALYFHYLTGLVLLTHPLYVWRRRDALPASRYAAAAAAVLILMVPSVPQLRSLFARRDQLEVSFGVGLSDLFTVLIPSLLAGSAAVGALVARRLDRVRVEGSATLPGAWTLVLSWWAIPPLILFLVSVSSETTLFEPRFLFFSGPGLALAFALLVRSIEPARARRIVATTVVAASIIGFASTTHAADDWRAAIGRARAAAAGGAPVLLRPGFIESRQLDWLSRPGKVEYLLSPLSPYPLAGGVIPLPYGLSPESERYLEGVVETQLSAADRFVLVNDYGAFEPWLRGRLAGWSARTVGASALVSVVVFERDGG